MAIVSALEYNTFFRGLKVSHTRLSNDTLERILHVLKRSMWLEELHLEGLGLKSDFIHKLAVSVISNNNPALKTIDLNHNLIEDKGERCPNFFDLLNWTLSIMQMTSGASSLCALIGKLVQGLLRLSLGIRTCRWQFGRISFEFCFTFIGKLFSLWLFLSFSKIPIKT